MIIEFLSKNSKIYSQFYNTLKKLISQNPKVVVNIHLILIEENYLFNFIMINHSYLRFYKIFYYIYNK